jgi:hypothetical protein
MTTGLAGLQTKTPQDGHELAITRARKTIGMTLGVLSVRGVAW